MEGQTKSIMVFLKVAYGTRQMKCVMCTVNPCQFYAYDSFVQWHGQKLSQKLPVKNTLPLSAIASRNNNYLHLKNHVKYFEQDLCKKLCASEGWNFNNCLDDLKRMRKHESRVVLHYGIYQGLMAAKVKWATKLYCAAKLTRRNHRYCHLTFPTFQFWNLLKQLKLRDHASRWMTTLSALC